MERVRIRSMLNNFKSHHLTNSARTTVESVHQHLPLQQLAAAEQQKNKFHHSCFILEPPIDDLRDRDEHGCELEETHKSSFATIRQTIKRKTKIANRSYMMTLPVKTRETGQNLKELGIRTKKINDRKQKELRNTDKIYNFLNSADTGLNSKNISERVENPQPKPRTERKKSVPDTWRHQVEVKADENYPKSIVLPWRKSRQVGYNIRNFKFGNIPRKNSDICPWEFESTNILA